MLGCAKGKTEDDEKISQTSPWMLEELAYLVGVIGDRLGAGTVTSRLYRIFESPPSRQSG